MEKERISWGNEIAVIINPSGNFLERYSLKNLPFLSLF